MKSLPIIACLASVALVGEGFAQAYTSSAQAPPARTVAATRNSPEAWSAEMTRLMTCLDGVGDYPRQMLEDSLLFWGEAGDFLPSYEQIVYFERCIDIAEDAGHMPLAIEMMRESSSPYRHVDSMVKSYRVLYKAVQLARVHDTLALARLNFKLGYNSKAFQDYGNAVAAFLEAKYTFELNGEYGNALNTSSLLFDVYFEMGDYARLWREVEDAERILEAFTASLTEEGHPPNTAAQAFVANYRATAAALTERPAVARAAWEQAYYLARETGEASVAEVVTSRLIYGSGVYSERELRENFAYARALGTALDESVVARLGLAEARLLGRRGDYRAALDTLARIDVAHLDFAYETQHLYELTERYALALGDTALAYRSMVDVEARRAARMVGREKAQLAYHEARLGMEHINNKLARLETAEASSAREARLRRQIMLLAIVAGGILLALLVASYYFYRRKAALGRQLEAKVHEKTADLRRRNEELRRFNHVLAHDLKEPLRSVVSFSQLAARRNRDDAVGEYLRYASTSARQLDDLVSGMLGYQEEPDASTAEASLGDLVADVSADTRRTFPRKDIAVTAVDLPPAFALPAAILREALEIAFANAALFNDNEYVEITVQYVRDGRRHRLAINDNGIGIAADYHERVFEIFKRLHVREAYPGAGIGLARLRRILLAAGGTARIANSTPGFGTTLAIEWRDGRRRHLRTLTEQVTYRGNASGRERAILGEAIALGADPEEVPEGHVRLRWRGANTVVPEQ